MAKISIIIPVYNVEKYLQQCIDSLLSQTLSDIEIICIDDASQDASGKILNDYAARDDRMKVIHADENMGTLRASNNVFNEIAKSRTLYKSPFSTAAFSARTLAWSVFGSLLYGILFKNLATFHGTSTASPGSLILFSVPRLRQLLPDFP